MAPPSPPPPAGRVGADLLGDGRTRFRVWAPESERVTLHVVAPEERSVPLERIGHGYHEAVVEDVGAGSRYLYDLGEVERPDPASRLQPDGVHGPSEVVDPSFDWSDEAWRGIPLSDHVFYELHVGTFTDEGTFEAIIPHLERLRELGVTTIELLPIAQFPGGRNWGYDGVYPWAVQHSYGGPDGLRTLVDACHRAGLAVALDVVYNHLGPEGNYLRDFGPYFTDRYRTPWGDAINFDGPGSTELRRYFIENALYWITDFHIDALRLDAVHAMLDLSAEHFLEELGGAVGRRSERLGRSVHLIAESALNAPRMIRPRSLGGYGMDAQWNDDFHHALHVLLTGEREGYYADYQGVHDLAKAYRRAFVYTGERSSFRGRRHGAEPVGADGERFVVFAQNHDQVGNRMRGERLSTLVSFEAQKLAAAATLLSPYLPLLFMGEEYGEPAPFPYFISHGDPDLVEAVREGRREEFASFAWAGEPPDPQATETFESAMLDLERAGTGRHAALFAFHRELLRMRRETAPFTSRDRDGLEATAFEDSRTLFIHRSDDGTEAVVVLHFDDTETEAALPFPPGSWQRVLDSADERWAGPGPSTPEAVDSDGTAVVRLRPESCVVWVREEESDSPMRPGRSGEG